MKLETALRILTQEGSIERVSRGQYIVNPTTRARALTSLTSSVRIDLDYIKRAFLITDSSVPGGWLLKPYTIGTRETPVQREEPRLVLRTIERNCYHSCGNGTSRRGVTEALRAIPLSGDGIRRSYGLEWEIYALDAQQEDKLARLLDTLPSHVTERDGSLSHTGVEIIFLPMSEEKYKATFKALQTFCRENHVDMNNTGAHTTYGVSNSHVEERDLQIRLNRIAMAVKAGSIQRNIKRLFGRDFTSYAHLPRSLTEFDHSQAWSASRGTSAYELRLVNWEADVNRLVEFIQATEFVFNRVFTAQDFLNIFTILGENTDGE